MPMDEFRQLSVTFPDCFVSSVLGAVSVVTFMSYNFSTGEKRHGSLFRSFIERYMKISFSGVFFVFSFQLSDILIKCFEIYELESVRSTVKYVFRISWIARQIFIKISMVFTYLYSLLIFRIEIPSHSYATQHWSVGFPVMWSVVFLLQSSSFAGQQLFPDSRFMTCFSSFQNCFTHVFLFFFSHIIPKRFNNPVHEE